MSESHDEMAARIKTQLDGGSDTLPSVREPAMNAVYQRLGMTPATEEEFASLVDEMGSPDGEG
jgi:hypothetical protein